MTIEIPEDWTMPAIKLPDWMPVPTTIVVGEAAYNALVDLANDRGTTVDALCGFKVVKAGWYDPQ